MGERPQDRILVPLRADLHGTHATSSRQAYYMTYDCRSVLKHVLKFYDIFSDVHNNRKLCRGLVVSPKIVPCKSALRGSFQIFRRALPSFLYGSPSRRGGGCHLCQYREPLKYRIEAYRVYRKTVCRRRVNALLQ